MPLPIVPAPTTPMISATVYLRRKFSTAPVGRLRRRRISLPPRVRGALRLPVERVRVAQRAAPLRGVRRAVKVLSLAEDEPERVDAQRRPEREAERREARRDDARDLRPTLMLQHPVGRDYRRDAEEHSED